MSQRSLLAPLVLFLVIDASVCATTSSTDSPNFTLSIPPSFSTSVTVRHYRKGEDILNSPPYRLTTAAPMTEYHAWFGPRVAKQADNHWWAIRVYAHFSPKAATAYASATDGFQADLNEGPEFLGSAERSYMFARFERKHFRWGNAVSFFSQSTQDTMYVPNNGHLMYEVWGVTWNRQCTVVASVGVSHPKLTDWGPGVRDAGSIEILKKDRDYKLVETCSPEEFEPTLTAFDRLVDSLEIK